MTQSRFRSWTPALLLAAAGTPAALAAGGFPPLIDLGTLSSTDGAVIIGIESFDGLGASISGVGDINGDGVDDVVLGAPGATSSGRAYLVFGDPNIASVSPLSVAALDGTNGVALNGQSSGDQCGGAVSGAGDVNGDGFNDAIIGAYYATFSGIDYAGKSYVVFGGPGVGGTGLRNLGALDGTDGFLIRPMLDEAYAGFSVSDAGDVNGDGVDDLVIGGPQASRFGSSSGEGYVIFGGPEIGAEVGAEGLFELTNLAGNNGFVVAGVDEDDQCGRSVSNAGDINGDGIDDLIIGAGTADGPNGAVSGQSYVYFGSAGIGAGMAMGGSLDPTTLNGADGFVINGETTFDYAGFSVASAGDCNGDGFDDLFIGAPAASPSGTMFAGQVYVVFGGSGIGAGGTLELSTIDGSNGFVLEGLEPSDFTGFALSVAGDINSDGVDDLVMGVHNADPMGRETAGVSYLIFGGATIGASGAIDLATFDGSDGVAFIGALEGDSSGWAVSAAGDFNDDGIDDFIIGARRAEIDGDRLGAAYVIFGRCILAGDVNGDGVVDTADLGVLIGEFGTSGPGSDLNGDLIVDTADLGILIGSFSASCD